MTHCSTQRLLFHQHESREVTAAFDGGRITSDGGGLLLREVEQRFGIVRSFAGCFTDHREPEAIEFRLLGKELHEAKDELLSIVVFLNE